MARERTFSIIKPDATRRNITGKIISKFEEGGLRVVASKRIRMTRQQAAVRARVSWSTVARAERGSPGLALDTMCAVSAAVGLLLGTVIVGSMMTMA